VLGNEEKRGQITGVRGLGNRHPVTVVDGVAKTAIHTAPKTIQQNLKIGFAGKWLP
jgi:hypothetical protein